MVLGIVASRSSSNDRGRGGPPKAFVALLGLVGLLAAYLSNCIPGFGIGGSAGTPGAESKTPAEPAKPTAEKEAKAKADQSRISIAVKGDKCVQGSGEAAACPEVCAGLDRKDAATVQVEVDASAGRHGTVEALRACLKEAGFTDVRVRSE
ncbi:MAG: hypothetical protein AAF799_24015 [Myxococcota bacterium]